VKHKKNKLLAKIILAVVASMACLVVIEISLQIIYGNRTAAYTVSPGGGKTYEIINEEFIHTVRTNSLNIRDEEVGEKQPDEYRILFTGDSFTFGVGVEFDEAFHTRIEETLVRDGKPVNAINLGGKREVYWETAKAIDEMKGDAMVVQIFIGNDFYDLQTETNRTFGNANPETTIPEPGSPTVNSPTGQVQPTESKRKADKRAQFRQRKIYTLQILWRNLIKIEAFDNLLFKKDLRYGGRPILLKDYPQLEQSLVERELEILAHMHDAAKARDMDFYVFIVPFKVQCLKANLLDKEKYDYKKPNRILREFFAKRGVPCLDFLELYDQMEHRRVKSFYYLKDMHWTPEGHKHAAKAISEFLAESDNQFQIETKK
jgi:hypothetical protein